MTPDGSLGDWTTEVIDFLSANMQLVDPADPSKGWEHTCTSAYQIGCEALAALGQAEEIVWGAVPLKNPQLPDVLPRWDDISVAVLWLAEQRVSIQYRLPDGSVPPPRSGWTIVRKGQHPPSPNIVAAHGLGPAHAASEVLSVLEALGLIAKSRWTRAAETVLWRNLPSVWGIDFTCDPRFTNAVEKALDTMPDDIRAEVDRLATITDADIAASMAETVTFVDKMRAQHGKGYKGSHATEERARRNVASVRRSHLDWLFFRRWRLAEGWLTPEEAARALGIFHDQLAGAVRRAIIARLYPNVPFLADA